MASLLDDGGATSEADDVPVDTSGTAIGAPKHEQEVSAFERPQTDGGARREAWRRVLEVGDGHVTSLGTGEPGGDGDISAGDCGEHREEEGLDAELGGERWHPVLSEVEEDEVGFELREKGLDLGLHEI